MPPKRRYERLQFWYASAVLEDWISLDLKDVAPGDLKRARGGNPSWQDAVIGAGVRQ